METSETIHIEKKIETNENKGNIIIEEKKDVDKTFNTLKKLQAILKKESALKELCKEKLKK